MQFKDRYLSSIGLTEQAVAANMLANYYLLKLEGVTAEDSPSQVFLAKIPRFHDQLQGFVESHMEVAPPLPQGLVGETISELFNHLQKREYGFTKLRLNGTTKNAVLDKARN